MAVCYKKLWKLLIDKDMKRVELKDCAKISTNVLAKLGHDEPVSMNSMEKICNVLDCNIGDVMEFLPAENN